MDPEARERAYRVSSVKPRTATCAWRSPWKETFREFLLRIRHEGGTERVKAYWALVHIARVLAQDDLSNERCLLLVAGHFQPFPDANWNFGLVRVRLIRELFTKLTTYYQQPSNDGGKAYVTPSGELSETTLRELRKLPEGSGPITIADIRWVMARGEERAIRPGEFPTRGHVALWRSYKENPAKWLEKWAPKLLDATDPDAAEKDRRRIEEREAMEHSASIDKLNAALAKFRGRVDADGMMEVSSNGDGSQEAAS